jgi:serine protease Do
MKLPKIILSILPFFFFLSGCATPRVNFKEGNEKELKNYNHIFLFPPENDPRNAAQKVRDVFKKNGYEVTILDNESDFKESHGTAFIVSGQGHLLTCNHVLKKAKIATAWIGEDEFLADVLKTDEKMDLALLKIRDLPAAGFVPLRFSAKEIYAMGQEIYTIGFPLTRILGSKPRLNRGLISSEYGMNDNPDHVQISAEIQPGNSGSPLLNTQREVVGLIQQTINPLYVLQASGGSLPQNVNFAVKAGKIHEFLKGAGVNIEYGNGGGEIPFDIVRRSVAKLQAGKVLPKNEREKVLFCTLGYVSFWDFWPRFQVFELRFYDYLSGDVLFTAGQYRDNVFVTEGSVIRGTVRKVINTVKTYIPEKKEDKIEEVAKDVEKPTMEGKK